MVSRISMSLASGASVETIAANEPSLLKTLTGKDSTKASYKLEIHFGPDRTSLSHKLMAAVVTIWESGRRLHGGGDEKMYWCGYPDCGKPFSTDNFAHMHAVCPKCRRELHLDPVSRQEQLDYVNLEGLPVNGLDRIPIVVGEKLLKQTPPNVAKFLAKTWYALDCDADIYLKFHPKDIRFDKTNFGHEVIDKMKGVRAKREPVIYSLSRILADTAAGGDVEKRILAMITA
jgi:hypothetical protein